MSGARILIAGGGIGGLAAGLALARGGHAVQIYEQAPVLAELGAGISLSQAAQSAFRWLGVANAVVARSTPTADMAFLHYGTARLLAGAFDHGEGSGDPAGALAVRQMHRADLHDILAQAFRAQVPEGLQLGRTVVGVDAGPSPTLRFADGTTARGDIVIGADGLKSPVRRSLHGDGPARFTRQVAYRFLVDRDAAAPFMQHGRAAMFQGPGRVFNRYTIRAGALVNCVGVAQAEAWTDDGWSIPADRPELLDAYAGWHPDVTGLIAQATRLIKLGIFDRVPLARWSAGAVTLLGDAAHPMLPFLGLGAAMAIEDAVVLARALDLEAAAEAALARYEAARQPRTALVHAQSQHQSALVQASDPDRFDAGAAPSHDPAYYAYDPVSALI